MTMTLRTSLCSIDPTAEGAAPEWVQVLPAGPEVDGVDGRRWRLSDVQAVAQATRVRLPLVVDWEHQSETPRTAAPAAGWITDVDVRGGELWARVDWTPVAAGQIARREYRYLSPVIAYSPTTREIAHLDGAGLVHRPNLDLRALNNREDDMDLKPVTQALGLPDGASVDEIATAIGGLHRAVNTAQQPPLDRYVPRSDYDLAVARASNAEAKVAQIEAARIDAEIEAAISAALTRGKIAPASADYHRSACRAEGGLAAFKAFVDAAPALVRDQVPSAAAETGGGVDDVDRAVCAALGLSLDTYRAAGGA
ncbi:phage protease (plasmid) [Tistrella mobilis]|uniref:phage protease n=1 Tax=Tistrella mobilis TaxID=171437 RepID=UPI00355713B3